MLDINQRLCPAEFKLNNKNGSERSLTLPNSIGFGLCSIRASRKKVWRQPHYVVLVRIEMEIYLRIRVVCVLMYGFANVSRLGLNLFPPPLTQSESILGLQLHDIYVPKMSYPTLTKV